MDTLPSLRAVFYALAQLSCKSTCCIGWLRICSRYGSV